MLVEINPARQNEGEPRRRVFVDEAFDLYVWFDKSNTIIGFQLAYDKKSLCRALTWWTGKGYFHNQIDDGEDHPLQPKSTPVLIPDGAFNKKAVANGFAKISTGLEQQIVKFVLEKVSQY